MVQQTTLKSLMSEKVDKACNVCTDFTALRKKNRRLLKITVPEEELECPPDASTLGQSTWTFLHTMAAYYPEKAELDQQKTMIGFIEGLSQFYPCDHCAEHLRTEIKINPPRVASNVELSDWFCQIHNEVNVRQGKPTFPCDRVFERWRDGSKRSKCFN